MMKVEPKSIILAVALFLTPASAHSLAPSADGRGTAAPQEITASVGFALQGDTGKALTALRPLAGANLSPADRSYRDCMIERFGTDAPATQALSPDSPFSARLIDRFRTYWRQATLEPGDRGMAENVLKDALAGDLGVAPDWPALEAAIRDRASKEGRHVLLGQTGPLREMMLWGRERDIFEEVDLPDGSHRARVIYLEEFSSLGWGDWATCGRRGAGGWATSDALHAVTPRYASLEGEEFRVTFLGHEAQHFADLTRYKAMAPWELEYRAKLTELAQVRATRSKVLTKFIEDQSSDTSLPHSYANRRVLTDLAARLKVSESSKLYEVDIEALNAAARQLHHEDSAGRSGRN